MTINECIKKHGWNMECEQHSCRWMCVEVSFLDNRKLPDEVSFDIRAYDKDELAKLYENFCRENGFPINTVEMVTISAMAATHEILEEIS